LKGAIIADTGGLLRAIAAGPNGQALYPEYEAALLKATRIFVPALVLSEVDYFLRAERRVMRRLVDEIFDPDTTYEYVATTPTDVVRGLTLDEKFASLELGLVDGVVAAVAERLRVFRVLTTDRKDFGVLRVGARYGKALTLVP
jgi:predicted nucleic acid-binding protein